MPTRSITILFIILLLTVTLSNNVYADNTMDIRIKQNMNVKIKSAQITSEGESGSLSSEVRFVTTLDGKINDEYLAGKFILECRGASAQANFGPFSTSTSIPPTRTTIYMTTIPTDYTYTPTVCGVYVVDFKIHLKDLNKWFTNIYGKALASSGTYQGTIEGLSDVEAKITYGGLTKYKGVPVFKFNIDLSDSSTMYGYRVDMSGRGTIYIYTGLYYPLYFDFNILATADMGYNGKITISVELHVETIEHNLPSNSVHVQYEQGDFIIVAGGYPKAKIRLEGRQGDNKIIAYNEGTDPGYVSIIYKTGVYNLGSLTLDRAAENYVLMPGENITINLKAPLSKDLDIRSEASSSSVMTMILSVVLIMVIAIPLIIHRMTKSSKARASPAVPSSPAPETPLTPQPPSQHQPPPASSV